MKDKYIMSIIIALIFILLAERYYQTRLPIEQVGYKVNTDLMILSWFNEK